MSETLSPRGVPHDFSRMRAGRKSRISNLHPALEHERVDEDELQHRPPLRAIVPDLVLERVVEHQHPAGLPSPLLPRDLEHCAASRRHTQPEVHL